MKSSLFGLILAYCFVHQHFDIFLREGVCGWITGNEKREHLRYLFTPHNLWNSPGGFPRILLSLSEKRSQRQGKLNFNNILSLTALEQRLSNTVNYLCCLLHAIRQWSQNILKEQQREHLCFFTLGIFSEYFRESPLQRYHLLISSTGVHIFHLSHLFQSISGI